MLEKLCMEMNELKAETYQQYSTKALMLVFCPFFLLVGCQLLRGKRGVGLWRVKGQDTVDAGYFSEAEHYIGNP